MSEDVAGRLRELAHDHFEGRLNLAAYRRLRAPLLDSVAARRGEVDDSNVVTQPRAAVVLGGQYSRAPVPRLPPASAPVSEPTSVPTPTDDSPPRAMPHRSRLGWAILVLLLTGAAVAGWLTWR
jgi:hypothetical protein